MGSFHCVTAKKAAHHFLYSHAPRQDFRQDCANDCNKISLKNYSSLRPPKKKEKLAFKMRIRNCLFCVKLTYSLFRVNTRHSFHMAVLVCWASPTKKLHRFTSPLQNSARRSRIFNDSHFSQCDASTTHFKCDMMCVINSLYDWLKIWSRIKKDFVRKKKWRPRKMNRMRRTEESGAFFSILHFSTFLWLWQTARAGKLKMSRKQTTTLFPIISANINQLNRSSQKRNPDESF